MRVIIAGAGAMGCLFGSYLAQAGRDVCLLDIWEEHIERIRSFGLRIEDGDNSRQIKISAVTKHVEAGKADLVVCFVKSASTRDVAEQIKPVLMPHTRVLTLQNGLGNSDILAEVLGTERIMTGTTAQGATLLGPGIVMQGGKGDTHIGRFSGTADEFTFAIAKMFENAGIHTHVTDNVQGLVWGKLIVNIGINAVTALLGLRNGQIAEVKQVTEVAEMAVKEALQVADAIQVELPYADPMQKVLDVARATAQNKSSMLQDIRNHRLTEVEAINGAIVRLGLSLGIPTPVNRTLTLLVEAAQQHLGD